jgi:tricorn protease
MTRVTSDGYLRYPHIHGDLITLVAEDDIWLAPADGGRAWRLSSDSVAATSPRFSRDGAAVAWTSWRDGDPEVYVADTGGSALTRLTYWNDPRTRVGGWTAEGEVIAVSAAGQFSTEYPWAFAVPAAGGPARRLSYGPVTELAIEAEATGLLTGRSGGDPAHWKRYRGGTAGKLWTATKTDPLFTRVLGELTGQLSSPMVIGGRLFFLSDHEGTGNIYSAGLDGSDLRKHTEHDGRYARNATTDGTRIVYHVAGDIWILDSPDASPRVLEVTLSSPATTRAPRLISAADYLGDLDCDQTGQASVVEVCGTVHWLTHSDGPARALWADPRARARMPRVLGDGKVAWVTDADGPDAIEVAALEGQPRLARLAAGSLGSVTSLAASPDGTMIAAAARDGRLLLVDTESGQVTEVAAGDDGEVSGLAWSPDSAWLAWSEPGPRPLARIRLARVADGSVTDVTDGRFADSEPVFTLDGLYLAFLSRRTFDPVQDSQAFDLAFPYGTRPYLVTLAAVTPSPFGPLSGGRPPGKLPAQESERPVVAVDTEGMPARVITVPVAESDYSSLRAVRESREGPAGLVWLRAPVAGVLGDGDHEPGGARPRAALEWFDPRKREVTVLAAEADWFTVSGDGTRLVVRDGGRLQVLPADPGSDDDVITVDLSRARFTADPDLLWRHAYLEAGRLMRRDFWREDMSGVDWDGVLESYRPLLDRVRGPGDFCDLLWEVFGELGTSHAYVTPSGLFGDTYDDAGAIGQLGADVSRDAAGQWIIDRVLPGESSDPRARSPLQAPGVAVRAGDEILAVDGRLVDPAAGPWPLLAGGANKPVELTVRSGTGGPPRRTVIVPLRSDRRLRYQDWVAGRRRAVRELSGGRIGYLHIPDMMGGGWADFNRDLSTELLCEAVIVDVRDNRGGHISQLVVEQLSRRIIGWDAARYIRPESYPSTAPRGPVVTLADEFAGSDGDIVIAAIKSLGIGPVVGTRTWGGVVGIDGRLRLVDGTQMTVPRHAWAFTDYGWGVENYGVDPDIEVLNTPDDWAAGRDAQLETGVRIALDALAEHPAATPPPLPAPALAPKD